MSQPEIGVMLESYLIHHIQPPKVHPITFHTSPYTRKGSELGKASTIEVYHERATLTTSLNSSKRSNKDISEMEIERNGYKLPKEDSIFTKWSIPHHH